MSEAPLAGRVVLVTGASRGIGAATAAQVHAGGATVIRMARSAMPALEGALDIRVDLADPASRTSALDRVTREAGTPDVVISNAGAFLLAPLADTTDELMREQVAINVEAPLAIARFFLPAMRARGTGVHVIVGSVADWRGFAGNAAYAASKYAVRGLHEVLLEEYRGTGVRCTLVSPGPTNTAAWDRVDPDRRDDLPDRLDMLRPVDVADAIMFAITRPAHVQLDLMRLGPA